MFTFRGPLEISKSWMNRAFILQSFSPQLKIRGDSSADDVVLLKKALDDFRQGKKEFYAGLGGTTFRFLVFRLSREKGDFFISAEEKLLKRPQTEMIDVLNQLGVQVEVQSNGWQIRSSGWADPKMPIQIPTQVSSQFISAFLLSTVGFDFNYQLDFDEKNMVSEGYYQMTLDLLKKCGVKVGQAHQTIQTQELFGEVDVSSGFSLIAAGALAGDVTITNWQQNFSQPDIEFKSFFEKMGIQFAEKFDLALEQTSFHIHKQERFQALIADIKNCPDLFPVLSVLCAFAEGESYLFNAPQLKDKESNRIEKTAELLQKCGFAVEKQNDGLKIQGHPDAIYKKRDLILFDPDHDHRMAMAAGLLMLKGFPIRLPDMNVVNKSYPDFFKHIGILQ